MSKEKAVKRRWEESLPARDRRQIAAEQLDLPYKLVEAIEVVFKEKVDPQVLKAEYLVDKQHNMGFAVRSSVGILNIEEVKEDYHLVVIPEDFDLDRIPVLPEGVDEEDTAIVGENIVFGPKVLRQALEIIQRAGVKGVFYYPDTEDPGFIEIPIRSKPIEITFTIGGKKYTIESETGEKFVYLIIAPTVLKVDQIVHPIEIKELFKK